MIGLRIGTLATSMLEGSATRDFAIVEKAEGAGHHPEERAYVNAVMSLRLAFAF